MIKKSLGRATSKIASWSCLLFVAMMMSGCVNDGPPTPPTPGPGLTIAPNGGGAPSSDLLEPGNTITISFSGLSTLPVPFTCRIREDGTISPPYLDKQIKAAGKTIGTLEQELEKEYVPRIYRTINVTIRTADRFYFVGGEVRSRAVSLTLAGSQSRRPFSRLVTSPTLPTSARSGSFAPTTRFKSWTARRRWRIRPRTP